MQCSCLRVEKRPRIDRLATPVDHLLPRGQPVPPPKLQHRPLPPRQRDTFFDTLRVYNAGSSYFGPRNEEFRSGHGRARRPLLRPRHGRLLLTGGGWEDTVAVNR